MRSSFSQQVWITISRLPQNVHATLKPENYGCKITCQNQSSDAQWSFQAALWKEWDNSELMSGTWSTVLLCWKISWIISVAQTDLHNAEVTGYKCLGTQKLQTSQGFNARIFSSPTDVEKQAWAHSPNVQSDPTTGLWSSQTSLVTRGSI